MSYPYDSWEDIDWFLYDSFDDAKAKNEDAYTSAFAVLIGVGDPVLPIYITSLASAVLSLVSCLNFSLGLNKSSWNYSYMYKAIYLAWLECNAPPGGDVDMDAILSAMITATDDEYKKFIGIVDAYRIGLWNKPFNAEYYAALGRGFAT